MIKWIKYNVIISLSIIFLVGCASDPMLPSSEESNLVPNWTTFKQAIDDYNRVIPGETKLEQLKELGFDPYTTPNIRILSYLDVLERFIPNSSIEIDQLDERVRDCLNVREDCFGYEVAVRVEKRKRRGNLFLDLLSFRRVTQQTGWAFYALIVIKNDLVVYKIWSGSPNISEMDDKKRPLGFIQSAASNAAKSK